jgi:hypothetical protein
MDAVENTRGREAPYKQGRGQLAHQDMDKKKNKRTKTKSRRGTIYISPDGGHTVYEQNRDGTRGRLVEEDTHARMLNRIRDDAELFGIESYHARRKYPALKKAYDQYRTIWQLTMGHEGE